jgi:hypothetical protein
MEPITSINPSCIRNLKEMLYLKEKVESLRMHLSYHSFSTDSKMVPTSNQTNRDYLLIPALLNYLLSDELLIPLLKILSYIIVLCVTFFGNIMIIVVIGLTKSLKKSNSLFILNLAVCDLAILFSCVWVQIVTAVNKYWTLGHVFCKINSYFQMLSVIASVLTLTAIAVDRYIGILHPLKAKMRKRNVYYIIIGFIWFISFLVSFPICFFRTYSEIKWADHMGKA